MPVAAAAAGTERIELMTDVLLAPLRSNTELLAKQVAAIGAEPVAAGMPLELRLHSRAAPGRPGIAYRPIWCASLSRFCRTSVSMVRIVGRCSSWSCRLLTGQ